MYYFPYQQQLYTLAWTKVGGRLSERAFDNGQGILTIENVRPEDQGTYSCTGSNPKAIDMDEGVLTVSGWNYFFDRFVFYADLCQL